MTAEFDPKKTLFIGIGSERVAWYRAALPAMFMRADWVGIHGTPPNIAMATGFVKGATQLPRFADYDTFVVQQPWGKGWFAWIRNMQARGATVVYEIDDYLHGIRKRQDHDFRQHFGKEKLAEYELCMRVCDAMICSTEFIARRYRKYNKNTYVCKNGLDMGRYRLTRPPRGQLNGKEAVMIGWAGATGHTSSAVPWMEAAAKMMHKHDNTCLVTIGQPWASQFATMFPNRAIAVPFTLIEQYPAAMTMFDIALAPTGDNNFQRAKSQLRFYEAGALGLPVIGDPRLYDEIEDGVTGLHAQVPEDIEDALDELIDDAELRLELGTNAMEYVHKYRDMRVSVKSWIDALTYITAAD